MVRKLILLPALYAYIQIGTEERDPEFVDDVKFRNTGFIVYKTALLEAFDLVVFSGFLAEHITIETIV